MEPPIIIDEEKTEGGKFNKKLFRKLKQLSDDNYAEYVLFDHSYSHSQIKKALDLAKNYIFENQLMLTGGIAMDMALRTRNSRIYDDLALPDYDCIMPNNVEHAYKLAEILCNNDLKDVSAIYALHPTTMRVRVLFETVADFTFVPKKIYDNIPRLTINGFIVRNPNHQMIDMHHAFAYPYENAPREVAFARLDKDAKRFTLLNEFFPMAYPKESKNITYTSIINEKYDITPFLGNEVCAVGNSAYLLLLEKYLELHPTNPAKINTTAEIEALRHTVEIYTNFENRSQFTNFANSFVTKNTIKLFKCDKILDIIPKSVIIYNEKTNITIYDATLTNVCVSYKEIKVASSQHILMHLLFIYWATLELKYLIMYLNIKSICEFVVELQQLSPQHLIFLPQITSIFGTRNYNETFIMYLKRNMGKIINMPRKIYPSQNSCDITQGYEFLKTFTYTDEPFNIHGIQTEIKSIEEFESHTI